MGQYSKHPQVQTQDPVNMQYMQQRGFNMKFAEKGTTGHINCRLQGMWSIFISEYDFCWLLFRFLEQKWSIRATRKQRCLKNWAHFLSKYSGWIRLDLGRNPIFKCLCVYIYINAGVHVCTFTCESIYVHMCMYICVNSHILKMVSFKITRNHKRDNFWERNLKILSKQIFLLGNLGIFSFQAENLRDKQIIQLSSWRLVSWIFIKKNKQTNTFTPTVSPREGKNTMPTHTKTKNHNNKKKQPTTQFCRKEVFHQTTNATKTPDKSRQRPCYRFLWNQDELYLHTLLALSGLGRDFQKAHGEFCIGDLRKVFAICALKFLGT